MKSVRFASLLFVTLVLPIPGQGADLSAQRSSTPSNEGKKRAVSELSPLRAKAERGNAIAQYNLGLAYAEGRQTPRDLAEAYVWLTRASESGSTGRALENLLGHMSPEQIAEGRRRLGVLRTTDAYLNTTTLSSKPRGSGDGPVDAAGERLALGQDRASPDPAGSTQKTGDDPRAAIDARAVAPEMDARIRESQTNITALSVQLASARADAEKTRLELRSVRDLLVALEAEKAELAMQASDAAEAARSAVKQAADALTEARAAQAKTETAARLLREEKERLKQSSDQLAAEKAALTERLKAAEAKSKVSVQDRSASKRLNVDPRTAVT